MRPDTATAQFLQMLHAAGAPPLSEQPIDVARAGVKAFNQQVGGSASEVHRVEDRKIETVTGPVRVRLYWPREPRAQAPLPIVVHMHGGGFVLCDLDTHDPMARYYCRHAEAIVINVDYGLSPEHKFPSAVEEAYGAALWASEHAREIGGDASRIAVAGDSAGGNLAAVVCQLARDRGRPSIAFQALLYPVVDQDPASGFASRKEFGGGDYFLSIRDMEWFNAQYFRNPSTEVTDHRASPLRNPNLAGLPPAVVVTAGCDPLRDEAKAYADRLAQAGVQVDYRCFEGTVHAFASFRAAIPAADEALAFIAGRLRQGLRA